MNLSLLSLRHSLRRVTKKSDMRTWSNARGEGKLFSIDLLDEEGSEVKGTFFKADADKWFDQLQEGQVCLDPP